MLKPFLAFTLFIFFWLSSPSQDCPAFPESDKSGILSYIRLPDTSDISSNNIRFFYRLTVDCNKNPILTDLAITDPMDAANMTEIGWQLDSFSKVTAVIDPLSMM
jgi:hypothetical protein